jgi:hypothetical protein
VPEIFDAYLNEKCLPVSENDTWGCVRKLDVGTLDTLFMRELISIDSSDCPSKPSDGGSGESRNDRGRPIKPICGVPGDDIGNVMN